MFDYRAQPQRNIKDSSGYNYASHELGFHVMVPLYHKKITRPDSDEQNHLGLFLTPGVRFNKIDISYLRSRIFMNVGAGFGGYYHFKKKHTITAMIQGQINEDEFTINDPQPRFAGLLLYNQKVSNKFSYRAGLAYSYLFGNVDGTGYLFPVLGGKIKTGERSQLNITLPFNLSFVHFMKNKMRLHISLKPNGGVNRYKNRYAFATNDEVIILRRRSYLFLTGISYPAKNNLSLGADIGIVMARKITFTNESNSVTFEHNNIAGGLQFNLKLTWRPWQNALRNKEKENTSEDYDDIDTDILGF